jgi:hypothetical protein
VREREELAKRRGKGKGRLDGREGLAKRRGKGKGEGGSG